MIHPYQLWTALAVLLLLLVAAYDLKLSYDEEERIEEEQKPKCINTTTMCFDELKQYRDRNSSAILFSNKTICFEVCVP